MEQKDIDRIIEMVWEDQTPFEAIKIQFSFSEPNAKPCSSDCEKTLSIILISLLTVAVDVLRLNYAAFTKHKLSGLKKYDALFWL